MDTVAADQEWPGWLQGLLKSGAEALGVGLVGEPVPGLGAAKRRLGVV